MTNTSPPTQQISAIATANAAGVATFTFPMAPQGFVVSGTVNIPLAPVLAETSATLSGTVIGMWTGSNPWGPIEANPTQVLTLTTTSLTPGVGYTAVWMAGTYPVDQAPGNFPGALLTSLIVAVQSFVIELATGTTNPITVTGIPQNTECLVLAQETVLNVPCTASVIGGTTGFSYTGPYGVNVLSSTSAGCVVPFYGLLDSSAIITFDYISGAPVPTTVYASSQLLPLAIGIPLEQCLYASDVNNTAAAVTETIYSAFGPLILDSIYVAANPLTSAANANLVIQQTAPGTTNLLNVPLVVADAGQNTTFDLKGTVAPFSSSGQIIQVVIPAHWATAVSLTLRDLALG